VAGFAIDRKERGRVHLIEGDKYIVYLRAVDARRLGEGKVAESVKGYLDEDDFLPLGCRGRDIAILGVSFAEGGWAASQFICSERRPAS
jgi:hypothetical protein